MATTMQRLQATFSAIFQRRSLKTKVIIFTMAIFLISISSLASYANQISAE
jgi:hypothetical protein